MINSLHNFSITYYFAFPVILAFTISGFLPDAGGFGGYQIDVWTPSVMTDVWKSHISGSSSSSSSSSYSSGSSPNSSQSNSCFSNTNKDSQQPDKTADLVYASANLVFSAEQNFECQPNLFSINEIIGGSGHLLYVDSSVPFSDNPLWSSGCVINIHALDDSSRLIFEEYEYDSQELAKDNWTTFRSSILQSDVIKDGTFWDDNLGSDSLLTFVDSDDLRRYEQVFQHENFHFRITSWGEWTMYDLDAIQQSAYTIKQRINPNNIQPYDTAVASIPLSTDKSAYSGFESIFVSGTIPSSQPICIKAKIVDENDNVLSFHEVPLTDDEFSFVIAPNPNNWDSGNYKIITTVNSLDYETIFHYDPLDFGEAHLGTFDMFPAKLTYLKLGSPLSVEFSGDIIDYSRGTKVTLEIRNPDGRQEIRSVIGSKDGHYMIPMTIEEDWTTGKYRANLYNHGKLIGKKIFELKNPTKSDLAESGILTSKTDEPPLPSVSGFMNLNRENYLLGERVTGVQFSGKVADYQKGLPLIIEISLPDGTKEKTIAMVASSGTFMATWSINPEFPEGTYKASAIYLGQIMSSVTFDVEKITDESGTLEIPDWIRNNAKWWSEGVISDSDFSSGIEFMIKSNVMKIPEIPQSTKSITSEIPGWIRNNAAWWAEGTISDEDFVTGLQYLIENGMIKVSGS